MYWYVIHVCINVYCYVIHVLGSFIKVLHQINVHENTIGFYIIFYMRGPKGGGEVCVRFYEDNRFTFTVHEDYTKIYRNILVFT